MNERIDVLAVMDDVASKLGFGDGYQVEKARAAVSELIEAADGVDATHGPMLNGPVDQKVQQLALDRLRAALAGVVSP